MLTQPLILNDDFRSALDLLEHGSTNLFITGRAGTGKSTLLHLFKKTTRKKVVVLAPTGVAALNVGGQTIHSFFGFPPKLFSSADLKLKKRSQIFRAVEVIVIDEISMVRADLLDHIDYVLRIYRTNDMPFGGVQMVFVGDLFQLPPVVSTPYERHYFQSTYESPYFFSAKAFDKGFELETFELRKIYRQEERRFINILEAIRSGDVDKDLLMDLNENAIARDKVPSDEFITLTTRNIVAKRINAARLEALNVPGNIFQAKVDGHFNPSLFPTDALLHLKVGARVMFLKNDPGKKFVNGSIGTVHNIDGEELKVKLDNNGQEHIITVEKQEWEIIRYEAGSSGNIVSKVIGSFIQMPVKLAWAITVHKSQGKTFDKVLIDLQGGAFEHGQTYVALSRCRTMEGILLRHPVKYRDVLIDERVVDYYNRYCR